MTYDYELTLIGESGFTVDEEGIPTKTEVETNVLCGLKSVGREEFYKAAAVDLRPEAVFVIHQFEYSGEKLVRFNGKRFSVIRTYGLGTEEIELTCKEVTEGGS